MTRNSGQNTFIGYYVASCQATEQPLSDTQIGLLEKAIYNYLGLKPKRDDVSIQLNKIDDIALKKVAKKNGYAQPDQLLNIIREYRFKKRGVLDDAPLYDRDVISLHNVTLMEMQRFDFQALKQRHELPESYSLQCYRLIHEYLIMKGYVRKSELTMPCID